MRSAIAALVFLLLAATADAGTVRGEAAGLRFAVPSTWTRVPAPSDMRAAQYRVPRVAPDTDDSDAILFFFGAGKGGSAQDNLDRWYGQFDQPDGRASKDAATLTIRTVHGLRVTAVDLAGTFKPSPMMGGGGAPKAGYRMLAAVVEGEHGPWFWKLIGPQATVAAAKADFTALVDSLEAHE
jgi:hypothetical protein